MTPISGKPKLNIGYFYKDALNLYGDNGNVEILVSRCTQRGIPVEVHIIDTATQLSLSFLRSLNLVFMGGGPDAGQQSIYKDLVENKGEFLKEYIHTDGVGLFICGSYQLLGHYYKSADGAVLDGLGIYDMYTQNFGTRKSRCVGNVVASIGATLMQDPLFGTVNSLGDKLVGFCNHGGRTVLSPSLSPLAHVIKGFGNDGKKTDEGVHYKNTVATYFHGPFLARNSHIADYLIAKSLNLDELSPLDDSLIRAAHTASLGYK
jgi:lipid II isoglutaminyl synthase (glutamine-hydrolysing)